MSVNFSPFSSAWDGIFLAILHHLYITMQPQLALLDTAEGPVAMLIINADIISHLGRDLSLLADISSNATAPPHTVLTDSVCYIHLLFWSIRTGGWRSE